MSLARVSTSDLVKLRDLAASGALRCPMSEISLRANGFADASPMLAVALAFDTPASLVLALDLVIAERVDAERPPLELVWTGPDTESPRTRDTSIVLGELCDRAQKRVLVAGYVFAQGETILRPLYEALVRGVEVTLFAHLPAGAASDEEVPEYAARAVRNLLQRQWPFGPPYPRIFYDPRTARDAQTLLHAKCAVADGRWALVTSANYTGYGHERHIEVGVLIDDARFASRLEGQFNSLAAQGKLCEAKP